MSHLILPLVGTPLAWEVHSDRRCPEFSEIHWGVVTGHVGAANVEVLDETDDAVLVLHHRYVSKWIAPGFEPAEPKGGVWD